MRYSLYLLLLLIWCGFSGDFSLLNIMFGALVSAVIFQVRGDHVPYQEKSSFNITAFIVLIVFTLKELLKSSLMVAYDVLTPSSKSHPKVINIPIRSKMPMEKFLLTNLISITPGTIFIDFVENEQRILVHCMFAQERHDTQQFIMNVLEPKVLRVFGHA